MKTKKINIIKACEKIIPVFTGFQKKSAAPIFQYCINRGCSDYLYRCTSHMYCRYWIFLEAESKEQQAHYFNGNADKSHLTCQASTYTWVLLNALICKPQTPLVRTDTNPVLIHWIVNVKWFYVVLCIPKSLQKIRLHLDTGQKYRLLTLDNKCLNLYFVYSANRLHSEKPSNKINVNCSTSMSKWWLTKSLYK